MEELRTRISIIRVMKLLTESELIASPVVANSRMNRERNASGVNSYEKEFKFRPEDFLAEYIQAHGHVKWLDICCGEGKALIQAASHLSALQLHDKATLKGMDLIDGFDPVPAGISCVSFDIQSAVTWEPTEKYDLITCSHGLHYVGDKLKVLSRIFASLSENGVFYGHLDLGNIMIMAVGDDYLKRAFKKNDIQYNGRTKLLYCKGPRTVTFGLNYVGADDKSGPNYTGQEAVTSYYT
ncbi:class I SAM-dependent methyltransferase [Chitinophaga agri]|nr:methyltransferase domain-containing protein [Chitinophaga agri]